MRKTGRVGSIAWKIIGTGSAVVAAALAQKAATVAWRAATGNEPPESPEDPEIDWKEAAAWAALSGLAIGTARLAATRAAARYYHRSSGSLPKALQD